MNQLVALGYDLRGLNVGSGALGEAHFIVVPSLGETGAFILSLFGKTSRRFVLSGSSE